MPRPFLELPEATGLTIKTLRVYDDPPYGSEVHIIFTDGTQLSIDLEVATRVKARHCRSDRTGDLKILHQHEDPLNPNTPANLQ